MFFKKFLNQPNVIGSVLIVLMICSGLVYTFAFNGFNVETATGGEVEAWLAAAGGGSSGGSGGGGTDDTPSESPTPENPEDEEGEGEDGEGEDGEGEGEEGGTEDSSPEESLPEDDEDDEDDSFDWDSIDMKDTSTWPTPPTGGTYGVTGDFTVGLASKDYYNKRGEKSLYDKNGGEWRPSKLDQYHDSPHWDHKPYQWNDNRNENIGKWENIDFAGNKIPKPNE